MSVPTFLFSYDGTNAWHNWDSGNGTSTTGRTLNGAFYTAGDFLSNPLIKSLAGVTSFTFGEVIKCSGFNNGIWRIVRNGGAIYGDPDIQLSHVGDGRLYITGNYSGVSNPSSGPSLAVNIWSYVESQVILTDNGDGTTTTVINILIDGFLVLSYSFTRVNYTLTSLVLVAPGGGNSSVIDDGYLDTAGIVWGDLSVAADDLSLNTGSNIRATQIGQEAIIGTPDTIYLLCPIGTGSIGAAYSSVFTVIDATPPYVFSLTTGSFPTGITLNTTNGIVTGTPTVTGTFPYVARVIDDNTQTALATCTMTIGGTNLSLLCPIGTATINVYYSSALVAVGGVSPYTFSIISGALPPNIILDAPTGTLTGTPISFGTFGYVAKVVDFTSNTATASCQIVVSSTSTDTGSTGAQCRFKHWETRYDSRNEPAKVSRFRSDIETGDEKEWKVFMPQINCNGGIVYGTVFIGGANHSGPTYDGSAVSTFTITGSVRHEYTFSIPITSENGGTGTGNFGRTIWAEYEGSGAGSGGTGGSLFKHYTTRFWGTPEPPRVTNIREGPHPFPSNNYFKAWLPELDCINGTVTGSLYAENTLIKTSTFTGTTKQIYTVGMDLDLSSFALTTGSRWEAVYHSTNTQQFKHYDTKLDSDVDPLQKIGWSFHYRKVGGASQLDLGRFWSAYVDVSTLSGGITQNVAVATYYWDLDGDNFNTGTLTLDAGYRWLDRIAFPPGCRGRLFEFRLYAPGLIKVHDVNIDLAQEGIKGLTRRGTPGVPADSMS